MSLLNTSESIMTEAAIRHDWTPDQVQALFDQPFNDLLFQAQTVHRQHFNPHEVQTSTLLSIKTARRTVNIVHSLPTTIPVWKKKS